MKALPHVRIVGTNSLGILSDMLGKTIGDFYLTVSNEKYITPRGEMFEVKGVDVDTRIDVFPKENIFTGHWDAVKRVMEMMQ
jgi:C-terminal processing protease CtpA/Prc